MRGLDSFVDRQILTQQDQESIPQIPEEILVMKNFTGHRIDALLLNLRKAGVPKIA